MSNLAPLAEQVARLLVQRRETIALAESSTGGLIAAALLAVPGASAYFLGGAVIYTAISRRALIGIAADDMAGMRPSTEAYAQLCAERIRALHAATWGLGETGAAGPTGNRYGDDAGHSCIAIIGPAQRMLTIETGASDRSANMQAFAAGALSVLIETIEAIKASPAAAG